MRLNSKYSAANRCAIGTDALEFIEYIASRGQLAGVKHACLKYAPVNVNSLEERITMRDCAPTMGARVM